MIYWDVSPDIVTIGPFTIRWYGLLFALSFIVGYQIFYVMYKKENRPEKDLNDLIWYMILGTVIGARLGHCLFYNPNYYLSHPLEILQVWKGGLASHGAAIGILFSLYLFVKKHKEYSYLWILDRMVITVALGGFFIRMGNLFNSEIIGVQTDVPWAFIFASVDNIPRHPAQLYEAIAYLISFIFLIVFYFRTNAKFKPGLIFGLFLILIFGFRFFVEFIKEDQTYFEKGMSLNMGQLLSIPFVLLGIYLVLRKEKKVIKIQ
ncbi:MAG: prolipoprotein diacylglyceryl transferase [Bacteroidota bacterium]